MGKGFDAWASHPIQTKSEYTPPPRNDFRLIESANTYL